MMTTVETQITIPDRGTWVYRAVTVYPPPQRPDRRVLIDNRFINPETLQWVSQYTEQPISSPAALLLALLDREAA